MSKANLTVIILAAGKGTRMKSPLPKVLHPVAGEPMIVRIVRTIQQLRPQEIRVILGHGKTLIERIVVQLGALVYEQKEQRGTADAIKSADFESLEGDVLIVCGDHPLIKIEDLQKAIREFHDVGADLAVLTCDLKNPREFGRIVRQGNQLKAIVEAKDASQETLKIKEINTGAYLVKANILKDLLPQIQPHNKQGEYYLTDIVSLCVEQAKKVIGVKVSQRFAMGVNDQLQLAQATRIAVLDTIKNFMLNGVLFIQPNTSYVESNVQIESGAVIYPNVFLKGETKIGAFSVIEPNVFIQDSTLGESVQIKFGSHLDKVTVGSKTQVGPYARLRPDTELGQDCRVGNFVEMKKVKFGDGSKANHLTYLGDATVGKDVNIGCGTITCNYAVDKKKYETQIGDGAFIGSDTQFVAPVKVGSGAIVGSGSTITKDVPDEALAVARGKQMNIENYASKIRKKD